MKLAIANRISEEDYLAGEKVAGVKHEYLAGEVFAMAGASRMHATITLNIASALRVHLRGKPCRTYVADMKVRVKASSVYYYPDVAVTCSPRDLAVDPDLAQDRRRPRLRSGGAPQGLLRPHRGEGREGRLDGHGHESG